MNEQNIEQDIYNLPYSSDIACRMFSVTFICFRLELYASNKNYMKRHKYKQNVFGMGLRNNKYGFRANLY